MKRYPNIDRATKRKKVPVLENQIHLAIAKYLNMVIKRPSRWHTVEVSNQASGNAARNRQVALKARGVRTGWPDIEIFKVTPIHGSTGIKGGYSEVIFLEVKAPEGKLTEKQEALHQELREDGHVVHVVRSVEDVDVFCFKYV